VERINTLFWDVGGVILTNAWDRAGRRVAAERFGIDWEEFQDRHDLVSTDFETGHLTLEEYLQRTVFYRTRPFSREEFRSFMFGQSQPNLEVLELVKKLARSGQYLMATLNNESQELNQHRIGTFGLMQCFTVFFSSCFLRVRKPDSGIYRLALQLTQRSGQECLFIDDRALNLECAMLLGMKTVHFRHPEQLREELRKNGIREV
jgi:putative hydrolase of the HAD superfamily